MKLKTHLITKKTTVVTLKKASYSNKFSFNLRQKLPKNLTKYYETLDTKVEEVKDESPISLFEAKYNWTP